MKHEIIGRALGAFGDDRPAVAVADSAVRALDALFSQLEPLVGIQGTQALYVRCAHLTRQSFQWPVPAHSSARDDLLRAVESHLAHSSAADAWRASEALLTAFVNVLMSLVGAPLTLRLLQSAWGSPAAGQPSPENSK